MPVDPVALQATLFDYAIRTVWALLVVVLGLVLARAVRGTSMRALTRQRAHPNVTVQLRSLSAGKARYALTAWAPDREAAVAAVVGAVRARFPQWEIRDAQL